MENMELLDKKIAYSVRKLIAINSISYCYTELPIDRHCALFGRNNLGKTSLLNALKLHLFPEISFNDCKAKFAFKSSKGELYSTEDSYSYYFPADSSFLILEAENIHGSFCLILFKSNSRFGYQRLALPCAYDDIRAQFWDIHNTKVNNGLGSPVPDLGIPKIHALHQQYKDAGAVLLTTTKDIKEKLFSHNPMQRAKGRYCLVPLKEGGKERELSAFRQLTNFTFEIAKTDTKGLTETFATIIESGKINTQDKLHQDLQVILDEYNELRQSQDKLKAIANYRDDFKQLSALYHSRDELQQRFSDTFQAYSKYLNKTEEQMRQQVGQVEPEVKRLFEAQQQIAKKGIELQNKGSKYTGQLETLHKDLEKFKQQIEHFQKIQSQHPDATIVELRNALQDKQDELDEKISHLEDSQKAIDTLTAKVALKNSNVVDRNKKKQALEHYDKLLTSRIDEHSATVLRNLNQHFAEIMVDVDDKQTAIVECFAHLFTIEQTGLNFLGELFSKEPIKSSQQIKEQLQQELDRLDNAIQQLDYEIIELQKIASASGEYQKQQCQDAKKERERVQSELKIVNAIDSTDQQRQVKVTEIEEIENLQRQLFKQQEETQGLLEQNCNEHTAAKENLESLSKRLKDATYLSQRLQSLKPDDLKTPDDVRQVHGVSFSDLTELEGNQAKLNNLKQSLDEKINEFVQCGHFSVPVEIAYSSYSNEQQRAILDALNNTFVALPDQQETLQSRIIEHNKMTGAKISELTGNRSHIRSFINNVNKQFEHYSISNLKDIRVEIELDHRFEELVNELDRTNLNTTDIHDDGLYQRLNQFCADFFIGGRGNRILEMSKIITNVKYSYKKEHQDKREQKDQSNGTNALINCTLLTILLSDLLAQDSDLTLPVIFDEFSNLDEYNQRTAIQAATKHGFALFCASPTQTAEVVAVVDHYITLDDFHANTIYDASGERDVVFHHFSERLYDVTEQQAL
jgi:DNA repair exonuclease SbcCD ATPase subunit